MTDEISENIQAAKLADEAAELETVGEVEIVDEVNEPEYSEKELEALDAGWNPEGEDKDGNTLNADEYMARKPLFNKIHNMRDEMDVIKAQLATVSKDSKKMAKAFIYEKETLLEQLKEKREAALDDLDTTEVRKLDKQIEKVVNVKPEEVETYDQTAWKGAYISFLKENDWYDKQPGLKSAADMEGETYCKDNPTASPSDVYGHISKYIKDEFADRFEDKKITNSKVSTSTRRTSVNSKKSAVKLTDFSMEEQKVYTVMANAVGKSIEEYLNPK